MAATIASDRAAQMPPMAARFDRRDAVVFFALLAGLYAVFFSLLVLPYAFSDDYTWLDRILYQHWWIFPALAGQGRPLNGVMLDFAFRRAGGLAGMRWVRAVTIAEMAGMGFLFYVACIRAGWERLPSALLAALACFVPAMQIYAAWATSVPLPWAGICAAAAAIVSGWAQDNLRRRWAGLGAAVVLVLAGAAIYQPTAMVFWPIAALDVLRPPPAPTARWMRRRAAIHAITGGVGVALAWVVFKIGTILYPQAVQPGRGGFTHDMAGKLFRFCQGPLVDGLNLYKIHSTERVADLVAAMIVVGLFCYFGSAISRIIGISAAGAILLLANLPTLAADQDIWSYRTQIGMEWAVLVLAWVAFNGVWRRIADGGRIARRLPVIGLVMATCLAGALAGRNVTAYIAWPQATELSLLRIELMRPEVMSARRAILLQPLWKSPLSPACKYDEFGIPSLFEPWAAPAAIHVLREQIDPRLPEMHVKLVPYFEGDWTKARPNGTVLIDMRHL